MKQNNTSGQSPQQTPKQSSQQNTKQTSLQTPKQSPRQSSKQASKQASKQTPKQSKEICEGPITIGIDLGAQQGIERGMPVVTEAGLVGRIDKVYPDSSTVLLLSDASSAVDAMLQRSTSRAVGVVQGIAGGQPVMDYITQDADVSVGDLIITSGLGSAFPKGLVVGQVESVRRKDYEMYQQAVVRPTVKFDQLEIVLVITNFKPKPGQPEELTPVG